MTDDPFRHCRILIVDGKSADAKLLRGVLSDLGVGSVAIAANTDRALDMLSASEFQAVFCDGNIGPLDATAFSITLRRSEDAKNARVPIIVVSDPPHRSEVEASRDSGINAFILRPISIETVQRKLLAVLASPKPFIQNDAFCGPDRRRKRDRRATKSGTASAPRDRRKLRRARRSTDAKLQPQS